MSLRSSVFPAALALAGCLPTESEPPPALEQVTFATPETGGVCEVERLSYHVSGEVVREGVHDKSRTAAETLVVSVSESSSVIDCTEDLVRVATPGAELARAAFAADGEQFALDVAAMVIGGHRPSIRVAALLDLNENGRCDPGEPSGTVEVDDADELDQLVIAIAGDDCAAYQ